MIPQLPAADEVFAAAARIAGRAATTPVLRSRTLDALAGCTLFLKAEHLQRSGAFKFRGACNAVAALDAEAAGAVPLPAPVQWLMRGAAKVMTTTAHHV